ARSLRQEARQFAREAALAKPAPAFDVSIGAAYTDGEDESKTWNTPFLFKATWKDLGFGLKIAGDGYTHVRTPDGSTVSGLGDVYVALFHPIPLSLTSKVVAELGYQIAANGDVGCE